MYHVYGKATLVIIGVAACLCIFENHPAHYAVSPLDDESTDLSSSDVPSLESVHSSSSWISGTPSLTTQKSNAQKREQWKKILALDNAAYHAQDPEKKKALQREAQSLRNKFEYDYGI